MVITVIAGLRLTYRWLNESCRPPKKSKRCRKRGDPSALFSSKGEKLPIRSGVSHGAIISKPTAILKTVCHAGAVICATDPFSIYKLAKVK